MSPEKLEEILKKHRPTRARLAYLRSQQEMLERFLRICEGQIVEDMSSMSQALTGMPHGTTVGDPTGRLAIDIASGKVSAFIDQINEELEEVKREIRENEKNVQLVEIVLDAMNERERKLVVMKYVDEMSWKEIIAGMNREYNGGYAKSSLHRILETAMAKAYEVVR